VVKWFAGNRLRFFAAQNLLTPIDDVWAQIGSNYTDAFKTAATGADGHQYLVPSINYPWVVMYRKSLFTAKGYTVPTTLDQFVTLAKKMQTDGLVPLAFGDKDGWPAMGTFDILNMRMNGYQFHVDLMAGKAKWTDPKVTAVFQKWAELLPYFQQGAPGRTWQDAATAALVPDASGKYVAGMYFLGTFANAQVPAADQNDIGMFTFPTLGTAYDGENAMDAPIDGFMMSAHPGNEAAAKAFLACIGTPPAQKAYTAVSGDIAAVKNADASGYTPFQVDEAKIIAGAGKIAQFLDRDARADFAGPSGMQGFLLSFLNNPSQDLTKFLAGIQSYYDSLPPQ
jgi:multiple sugar transport system substrate-binding protein